jgi:hypothetical protein
MRHSYITAVAQLLLVLNLSSNNCPSGERPCSEPAAVPRPDGHHHACTQESWGTTGVVQEASSNSSSWCSRVQHSTLRAAPQH